MLLPVTGSPLHDCEIMTATSAATTTAPAMVRVRSRESTCRISVTLNQLLSWLCLTRPSLAAAGEGRYQPTNAPPVTKAARFIAVVLALNYLYRLVIRMRPLGAAVN